MSATRFSPRSLDIHDKGAVRGLMLACALQPASIKLLLGATDEEVRLFQDEARGTLAVLKERIKNTKGALDANRGTS